MSFQYFTRKEIVTVFCYLREAERSIHRALNPACRWSDFVDYYQPAKVAALRHFAERFQPALATVDKGFPSAEQARRLRGPGWLSILKNVCFGHWQRTWCFSEDEIAYLGSIFVAILHLLIAELKPSADDLIHARMATYDAERIIEARCFGLSELALAQRVTHFDQTPSLQTLAVSEILRNVA